MGYFPPAHIAVWLGDPGRPIPRRQADGAFVPSVWRAEMAPMCDADDSLDPYRGRGRAGERDGNPYRARHLLLT